MILFPKEKKECNVGKSNTQSKFFIDHPENPDDLCRIPFFVRKYDHLTITDSDWYI